MRAASLGGGAHALAKARTFRPNRHLAHLVSVSWRVVSEPKSVRRSLLFFVLHTDGAGPTAVQAVVDVNHGGSGCAWARGQRVFSSRAAAPPSALLYRALTVQPSTTVAASARWSDPATSTVRSEVTVASRVMMWSTASSGGMITLLGCVRVRPAPAWAAPSR